MSLKVRAAARVARIGVRVIAERVRPRAVTAPPDFPASTAGLTDEWLTNVLCSEHPGARVITHGVSEQSSGTSTRHALAVTYNDIGERAGLPTSLFTKTTPDFRSRLIGAAAGEAAFYNTAAADLKIAMPRSHFAQSDGRSGKSFILLEDLRATHQASFCDPRTTVVDRNKAEDAVRLLAGLHGTFWCSQRFRGDLRWIWSSWHFQNQANASIDFRRRSLVGIERAEMVSPPEFIRRRHEVWPALMRSLELQRDTPPTLLHQDVHSRNWYVTGAGRMGLHDWQCVARGHWAQDLAYAISSLTTVDDRRAWERDLIDAYLDELAVLVTDTPSPAQAWLAYRQQVFHGLLFWHYTIGAGRLQPAMQPDEISLINLERMTQAVVDLESLDSLGG
jgi:hypothetical protein